CSASSSSLPKRVSLGAQRRPTRPLVFYGLCHGVVPKPEPTQDFEPQAATGVLSATSRVELRAASERDERFARQFVDSEVDEEEPEEDHVEEQHDVGPPPKPRHFR